MWVALIAISERYGALVFAALMFVFGCVGAGVWSILYEW